MPLDSHTMLFTFVALSTLQFTISTDTCTALRCKEDSAFDYEWSSQVGPARWGAASPSFSTCGAGSRQSPVNVVIDYRTGAAPTPVITSRRCVLQWAPAPWNFKFEVDPDFPSCGSVTPPNGTRSTLLQLHLHSPSEHRIAGRNFPLELHFVHRAQSSGRLAVVAVMVELGHFNPHLQALLDAAHKRGAAVVDLPKLVSATTADTCVLDGSLTTPPCTEGVSWVISLGKVQASLKQIGEYRAMVGEKNTNRPLQRLNGRKAACYAHKAQATVLNGFM